MTVAVDPVEAGPVESFARPSGNIRGFTSLTIEPAGKRLELFTETVPTLVRVAVLYDPANPGNVLHAKEVQSVGTAKGLLNAPAGDVTMAASAPMFTVRPQTRIGNANGLLAPPPQEHPPAPPLATCRAPSVPQPG